MKTYTITADGEVVQVSPYSSAPIRINASTKTEATKKLLADYRHQRDNLPALFIRNGAFLLVTAEPNGRFQADSGNTSRGNEDGRVFPLCSAGHSTFADARKDTSFAYYASEEYQTADKV